jgi:hypothetical protein
MTDPMWRRAMAEIPLDDPETNFAFDGAHLFRQNTLQKERAKHRRNPGAAAADPFVTFVTLRPQGKGDKAAEPSQAAPAFAQAFATRAFTMETTAANEDLHPFERVRTHQ